MLTHPAGQGNMKEDLTMAHTLWACSYMAAIPRMSSANVFYTYILIHFANIISLIISFI